ncbi:MAG: hypothetical protein ACOC5K_00250 [Chloroflexota bacterium]
MAGEATVQAMVEATIQARAGSGTQTPESLEGATGDGCVALPASRFGGSITNETASISSGMSMQLSQTGCAVTGSVSISPPLSGSGPVEGRMEGAKIGLTSPAASNDAAVELRFGGTVSGSAITGEFVAPENQQAGSWTVSAGGAAQTPPTVQPQGQGTGPQIDWGPLQTQFNIGNIRVERQVRSDPLGVTRESPVLAFTVESRGSAMLVAGFQARFYDSEGIEVAPFSVVEFEPDFSMTGGWQPGQRSRGVVLLPDQEVFSRVQLIRISNLF